MRPVLSEMIAMRYPSFYIACGEEAECNRGGRKHWRHTTNSNPCKLQSRTWVSSQAKTPLVGNSGGNSGRMSNYSYSMYRTCRQNYYRYLEVECDTVPNLYVPVPACLHQKDVHGVSLYVGSTTTQAHFNVLYCPHTALAQATRNFPVLWHQSTIISAESLTAICSMVSAGPSIESLCSVPSVRSAVTTPRA